MLLANAEPAASGEAKFRRYGNRYYLSEISVAGNSRRLEFRSSKAERELQIELGRTEPSTVDVAVLDASR